MFKIYIPLSEGGKYYILAELPDPSDVVNGELYFKVGRWYVRYERTRGTFEIQGIKNRVDLRALLRAGLKKRVRA